jgi:hypothetical protein
MLQRSESPINEKLDYAAMQQRLDEAVAKNLTIIPHVRFDFEGWDAVAYQILGLRDPLERQQWVLREFEHMVLYLSDLKAGDIAVSTDAFRESDSERFQAPCESGT